MMLDAWLWTAGVSAFLIALGLLFEDMAVSSARAVGMSTAAVARAVAILGLLFMIGATFCMYAWSELPLALVKLIGFSILAFAAGMTASIPIGLIIGEFIQPQTKKQPLGGVDSVLDACDFEIARDQLLVFFRAADQHARATGEDLIDGKHFVYGWDKFAADPCRATAASWLASAPDYSDLILVYFAACCPGGGFWEKTMKRRQLLDRNVSQQQKDLAMSEMMDRQKKNKAK